MFIPACKPGSMIALNVFVIASRLVPVFIASTASCLTMPSAIFSASPNCSGWLFSKPIEDIAPAIPLRIICIAFAASSPGFIIYSSIALPIDCTTLKSVSVAEIAPPIATENAAAPATIVENISGRTARPLFIPSIDFSAISDCLANSCIPEPNPRSKEPANLANSIPESLVVRIFFKEEIVGSYLPSTFERNPEPRFA